MENSPIMICLSGPADGTTWIGDVPVAGCTVPDRASADVQGKIFIVNKDYFQPDHSSPDIMSPPAEKWADGRYTIPAVVPMGRNTNAVPVHITVKSSNGNATVPINTAHFKHSSATIPLPGLASIYRLR